MPYPKLLIAALLLLLGASGAAAQRSDITIRIGGPADVPFGHSVGTVIVINHDAVIRGTVDNQVIVINGGVG